MASRSNAPIDTTLDPGERVRSTKVNAYLAISDLKNSKSTNPVLIPVSGINMNFSIGTDNLPQAHFSIPVGVAMTRPSTVGGAVSVDKRTVDSINFSNIQHIVDDFQDTTIIDLWVSLEGTDPTGASWGSKDNFTLVWHGYFAGLGYGSSRGQMTINISSIHWLHLLDNGSVISKDLVKGPFSDILASAQMETTRGSGIIDAEGLAEVARTASGLSVGKTDLTKADIWKTMLIPILVALMSPDNLRNANTQILNKTTPWYKFLKTLQEDAASSYCLSSPATQKFLANLGRGLGNAKALSVLVGARAAGYLAARNEAGFWAQLTQDLFNGILGRHSPVRVEFENLGLDGILAKDTLTSFFGFDNGAEIHVGGADVSAYGNITVGRNIAEEVARQCANLVGSQSAMDKLRTVASLFSFHVVANARSATISPALPIFRAEDVWRVLTPSQYFQIDYPPAFPITLSGVALSGDYGELQTIQKEPSDSEYKTVGEVCGVYIGKESGRMLPLQAPFWIRYRGGVNIDYNKLDDPDSNPAYGTTERKKTGGDRKAFLALSCDYCRALWFTESYKFRTMTVYSPLRFDIAPGSKIAVLGLKYSPDANKTTTTNVLGFVTDVSIAIDTNAGTAHTIIQLSHVRNINNDAESEKQIPVAHPLYQNGPRWSGSPLVRIKAGDMDKVNFTPGLIQQLLSQ